MPCTRGIEPTSPPIVVGTRARLPIAHSRDMLHSTKLVLLVLLGALAACRTTARKAEEKPAPQPAVYQIHRDDSVPDWLAEPLSWDKLQHIQDWLAADSAQASSEWRIEGELVLAAGRVELARRELRKDPAQAQALSTRIKTAKSGFERVLADTDATPAQKDRAKEGLERAERLTSAPPPATATAKMQAFPVVARSEWGALAPITAKMEKTRGKYTRITIHHSADPDPIALDGSAAKSYEAMREIQRAHMNGKDTHYGDIGYHFVIDPYGRVMAGRDLVWQGAHAWGDNNVQNIGICVIGNFDQEKPTQAALKALENTIEHLRATYDIPKSRVYCHRELRHTDCPGENLARWVIAYRGK